MAVMSPNGKNEFDDFAELDDLNDLDDLGGGSSGADGLGDLDGDLDLDLDGLDDDSVPETTITFTVFFSADNMSAYVRAADYLKGADADNSFDPRVIYNLLEENGVTYGIQDDAIAKYAEGKKLYKDLEAAKGLRPEKGEDGVAEYFFSTEKRYAPKENADGTVNYKELGYIHNVTENDLLCRVTPPTEGIGGINVLGEPVEAKPGNPVTVNAGNGVRVSDDGLEFYAEQSGMVELQDGRIEVKNVYTVPGDVGPATGNIRFNGAVMVQGNVLSDYSIYANGDVIINGYVESSMVNSTGNIVVNNGINGMKKGLIKADGNVTTKFAEMSRIIAGGDFYCDYCINSEVRAGERIFAKGKRGALLGGTYIAGEAIDLNTAGSDLNIPMDLQIIPNWPSVRNLKIKPEERINSYTEEVSALDKQINSQSKNLNKIETEILKITKQLARSQDSDETAAAKKDLVKLMQAKSILRKEIGDIEAKKDNLDQMMECEGCYITVRRMIHTGVRVVIGSNIVRINGHKEIQTYIMEKGRLQTYNIARGPEEKDKK